MKNLIVEETCENITIDKLKGIEIVSYKCKGNKNQYATLCKLGKTYPAQYGFCVIGDSTSAPRFESNSWMDSIKEASKIRNLKIFNSSEELIEAIYTKKF
jgi:hypothetical protein